MKICNNNLTVIEPYEFLDGGYSMTLPQYRMFQYIIGETFVKDGLSKDTFYEVSINNFASYFGQSHKEAYDSLVMSLRKGNVPIIDLPEKVFTEGAKDSKRRKFILYNGIQYDTDGCLIKVRLAPELVEMYNKLGEEGRYYAKYILSHTRNMKSINSIRLFRLMNKWRSTNEYTNVGVVSFELEELKRLLGFSEGEYKNWSDFNRYVLQPSIAEIHKEAYLQVTVEVKKQGKKVTRLVFGVINKNKKFKQEAKGGELSDK